jgi:hypothetical protein
MICPIHSIKFVATTARNDLFEQFSPHGSFGNGLIGLSVGDSLHFQRKQAISNLNRSELDRKNQLKRLV